MLLFSIIAREFRSAARKKRAHVLRLLVGAAIATCVLFFAAHNLSRQIEAPGHAVYYAILWPLVFGLAILAPVIASSSISEERREGTLGLLFLTRLRPLHIVMAKFTAHLAEVSWFILLTIPFLAFPIWLGGIGADEIVSDTCDVINITIFGTAAGVCVSAFVRKSSVALVCALALPSLLDLILEPLPNLSMVLGVYGLAYSFSPDLLTYQGSILTKAGTPGLLNDAFTRLGIVVVATSALLGIAALRVRKFSLMSGDAGNLLWSRKMGKLIKIGNWISACVGVCLILLEMSGIHWSQLAGGSAVSHLPLTWVARLVLLLSVVRTIAREKDERTLESLVSTPLSNAAILGRKLVQACLACFGWYLLFRVVASSSFFRMVASGTASQLSVSVFSVGVSFALEIAVDIVLVTAISAFVASYARSSGLAIVSSIVLVSVFSWLAGFISVGIMLSRTAIALRHQPLGDGFSRLLLESSVISTSITVVPAFCLFIILFRNFRRFAARQ